MQEVLEDGFLDVGGGGELAQRRHIKARVVEERFQGLPHFLVGGIVGRHVLGQARGRAGDFDFLVVAESAQQGGERERGEGGRQLLAQGGNFEPRGLRRFAVQARQRLDDGRLDAVDSRAYQRHALFLADDGDGRLVLECRDTFGRQIECALEPGEVDAGRRAGEQRGKCAVGIGVFHRGELGGARLRVAPARRNERVDDRAAADGAHGRLIADDEAVAIERHQWFVRDDLHYGRSAGCNRRAAPDRDSRRHVRSAEVDMHGRPVLERLRFAGEHLQAHVEALRRRVDCRRDHPVAAMDMRDVSPRHVQCTAFAGGRLLRGLAVFLDAAHAHFDAARREHQLVAWRHRAVEYRAGDDGATAGDGEHAVYRVTQIASGVLAGAVFARRGSQRAAQIFDAIAAHRRYRQHVDCNKGGRGQQSAHARRDFGDALGGDAVGLGDDGDAAPDIEQIDDMKVLDGLRHDAVVGSDYQHYVIDAAHTGQHVAHEALVSGHVDEADHIAGVGLAVSEAEVDGNAALFFFRQAVGVDARQRFDQRGLAVIDVSRRGDDHVTPLCERSASCRRGTGVASAFRRRGFR